MNHDKSVTVYTVCNIAYLNKARVLGSSLWQHAFIKLKIFLIDTKRDLPIGDDFCDLYWIEDCAIPDLYMLAFKYDITEFSTAVKPYIASELLKETEKVIFFDPDICIYNDIRPIIEELESCSILLTPHYLTPEAYSRTDGDLGMMRFGSFNLGFFAVKNSEQGVKFLEWWSDRCFHYCYFEPQFGLSTDQKWISIAPCFFSEIKISFNMGYNVAMWNSHERQLIRIENGSYLVNNKFPLIFFHFSSFDEQNPHNLSKRSFIEKSKNRQDLAELAHEYAIKLKIMAIDSRYTRYGFDYMSDGTYLSPTHRRAYACVLNELPPGHNPFDSTGVVGEFFRLNHLKGKASNVYKAEGYDTISNHQFKFKIIFWGMKFLLKTLGPNQFYNFSRLLVYLSSYRQLHGLWELP
jgi:hypothetical protein